MVHPLYREQEASPNLQGPPILRFDFETTKNQLKSWLVWWNRLSCLSWCTSGWVPLTSLEMPCFKTNRLRIQSCQPVAKLKQTHLFGFFPACLMDSHYTKTSCSHYTKTPSKMWLIYRYISIYIYTYIYKIYINYLLFVVVLKPCIILKHYFRSPWSSWLLPSDLAGHSSFFSWGLSSEWVGVRGKHTCLVCPKSRKPIPKLALPLHEWINNINSSFLIWKAPCQPTAMLCHSFTNSTVHPFLFLSPPPTPTLSNHILLQCLVVYACVAHCSCIQ